MPFSFFFLSETIISFAIFYEKTIEEIGEKVARANEIFKFFWDEFIEAKRKRKKFVINIERDGLYRKKSKCKYIWPLFSHLEITFESNKN